MNNNNHIVMPLDTIIFSMWALLIEYSHYKNETWRRAMCFENKDAYSALLKIIDRINAEEGCMDNASEFSMSKLMSLDNLEFLWENLDDHNTYNSGIDWLFNNTDAAVACAPEKTIVKHDHKITTEHIQKLDQDTTRPADNDESDYARNLISYCGVAYLLTKIINHN